MKEALLKAFDFNFNELIWKIAVDQENGLLAVECRHQENKTASFSVIDVKNNKFIVEKYVFKEGWMSHLYAIHRQKIIVKHSLSENSPLKSGFSIFDVDKNEELNFFELNLHDAYKEGLVVYSSRISPPRHELMNWEFDNKKSIAAKELSNFTSFDAPDIHLPDFKFAEPWFKSISVLAYKNYQIKTLYTDNNALKNLEILVYKNNDQLVQSNLDTGIQKANPEPFFVWFSRLFYIKNKSEFVSYFL